jgi:hypothetical protein
MGRPVIGASGHWVWIDPDHEAVVVRWLDGVHAAGFLRRVAQALAGWATPALASPEHAHDAFALRHAAGGMPNSRLNARLKAASVS